MTDKADVMIVDDDPINLRFLEKVLSADYQIRASKDGYEALRLIKEQAPDIVLLDVMMPGLSGFEVCGIMRDEPSLQDIPVLFLTGMDNADSHVAGLKLGVVDYLLKPFSVVDLRLRVRNYVDMKLSHDRIRQQHDQLNRQKLQLEQQMREHRALEAKNQQLARMSALGEMATGVAHEINNPITGIINCAELLKNRLAPEDRCQEIVGRITREGQRIARIVRSLLTVAHPGEATRGPFPLGDSLESVLRLFENRFETAGVQVVVEKAETLPPIKGDRQKFEQLVINLISNAFDALNAKFPEPSPDKLLRISALCRTEAGGTRLALQVYDQGSGIPAAHLEKVFDPFFTTKPAGSGTGLGLALCFEIVKQFGGEIQVDSEPGAYTRFTVEFPLCSL